MKKNFLFPALLTISLFIPAFLFAADEAAAAAEAAAITASPEATAEATAAATVEATVEPTAVSTVETTVEPTAEATAEATAAPTTIPTVTEKVEVDTSYKADDEGVVILSPGETSMEELEKYILTKRKPAQQEETDNGDVTMTFEPESAEEENGGIILMEDEKKGKMESTGYVMVERGGFISDNFKEDGIVYSLDGREILAAGDNVYIKLTVGKGVKKGTEFIVYDDSESVINPMTDENMGKKIKIVAVGKVRGSADADDNIWKAKLTKTYEPAGNNFKIKIRKELKDYYNKLITKIKKKPQPLEGFIISVNGGTQGINNKDVVYIDRGLKDGIAPGDILTVVRLSEDKETGAMKKYNTIGKVMVINTMRSSSVGIISGQTDVIKVGDLVKTK